MAMESPTFDKLKEEGNNSIKEKRYQDAVECYSAALKLKPREHTVFSNRSLAYLRIGKLEESLSDAQMCVEVCPQFARGYMRKAVTLNMLQRLEESREAAVAGYLLRGSDSISKECVSQWLIATRKLYDDFYKSAVLPTGTVILSDAYFVTLFQVLQSRASSAVGMSPAQMERLLLDVYSQLKELMATFGHSDDNCVERWVKAVCNLSVTDPKTATLNKAVIEATISQSKCLAEWVNKEIDPILYPIVRPLLILAVMVVLSRTYVLNCMNLGHKNIQVLSQACLVFFEQSVLKTEEYLGHHVGLITGLLDSFIGRGTKTTPEDMKIMEHYCNETEKLLPLYEATQAWEKEEVKDIAIRVVANVRGHLQLESAGVYIHSQSLPERSLMSGEVAKRDALVRPMEVMRYMEKLTKEVRAKSPAEYFLRDAENLLHGSVGLLKLQQSQNALEAFKLGESVLFSVFALQVKNGLWVLEEVPSMISTSRNDVLLNAFALREVDPSLIAGVVVRWKCLFSEFRSLLIHFGLKGHFAKTFMSIDSLLSSGSGSHDSQSSSLSSVMQEYQHNQRLLLEKWGPALITVLSQQSLDAIQNVLEPNEAIFDITVLANYPVNLDKPGNVNVMGILLLILPQGKPIIEIADFGTLFSLSKEWPRHLDKAISLDSDPSTEHQIEADRVGRKLCKLLFPVAVEDIINSGTVECLYLCPDTNLSNLPLDLLPWADGKYLFEKCSISYLSCCREVLREWCLVALQQLHSPVQEENQAISGNENPKAQITAECNPLTNSATTECLIFADPDYDLEASPDVWHSSNLWELLQDSLGLSPQGEQSKVVCLPKSLEEAENVKSLLSIPGGGILKPQIISGTHATLLQAIQVKSPLVLHFSTHGFSNPSGGSHYGGNFWTDMTMGLALAGINTYRSRKLSKILPAAGTGELTAMAVCGMNLSRTRLVYLSTCVSSLGFTTIGESVSSFAQAFRAAGAETVVAALWPVIDSAALKFAVHFYHALSKPGTKPSQAVVEARQQLRQEAGFENWFFWGPFVCIGYNLPLFVA